MKTLEFTAYGTPKAQPRVRACRRGNHASVYDPGTADAWKDSVRTAAIDKWDGVVFTGPVHAAINFWIPRPKFHYRANGDLKPIAPIAPTGKPDLDNYAKAVLDALTALGVWHDDSQVVGMFIRKRYTIGGPCATIQIREYTEE